MYAIVSVLTVAGVVFFARDGGGQGWPLAGVVCVCFHVIFPVSVMLVTRWVLACVGRVCDPMLRKKAAVIG